MISFHKYISLTKFCLVIPALLLLVGIATAAAPTAAFSGTPTSGAAPLTVSFTDLSAGSPTGWAWFFGDETYTGSWTEQNASSGWMGRNGHSSVALPDGSILVMGGAAGFSGYQNDTWRSDDNGATWMPMNMSSGWSRRGDHSSVALPDGSVLVMGGGDLTGCMNDTWRSTDGGATWTSMNMSSGWTARTGSTAVTLPDGSIILTGGQESAGDSVEYRNDVWRSGDNGATWTNITPSDGNPWTARAWHTSVAMPDGSILLMGGEDASNRMNDVWRSDDSGATWTQLPDAGWTGRAYHTSVVMPDGSILAMGGYNTGAMNDVWRSDDGGWTWMQLPNAGWLNRQNPTAVALPDGSAIVMGGWLGSVYYSNDTWRFQPAGSTEENPTHTYTAPGTYTVTLQVFNDNGYNAMRMTDYITVTAPVAPAAAFSGTPTSGTAPLTVRFTDQSAGNPTGWAWFFGDETYTGAWTEQNASSGWSGRFGHTSVTTLDGNILLMGGCNDTYTRSNDTWQSEDGGRTWTQLPGADWTGRFGHSSVVLPDGDILVTGGGDDDAYQNDTWRSDDNGRTWTLVNVSSGWAARADHASVALPDGSILVMGGTDMAAAFNDTWRSIDRGTTWTLVNESPGWTERYLHTAVAMPDGSILVMGGTDIMTTFNDTWHSDDGGRTWTRLPDAGWTERYRHAAVAMPDDSILVLGGEDGMAALNDTWRSDDGGRTWARLPDAGWTGRYGVTAVAMPDGRIAIMGGSDDETLWNDTWRLQPAGSTEQNPTHIYTAPGTYQVTLQTSNAAGYSAARMTDYITVTAAPTPTPTSRPPSGGGGGGSTGGPDGYNVGGDSAVSKVTVTGTGLETLILTGWRQSSPGAGIPPAPGTSYQYIGLTPARFKEITGANITFTIPTTWLAEHGFTPGEIVMYHYNGTAWEALPTWIVDDSGATVTFRAATPGFSLFAISGAEKAGEAVTTPTAAQTTVQAVAEPTATQTAAPPAGGAAPDFPLGTIALVGGVILVLAAGGYLVRRWWIIRQNPALFRDYD